MNGKKLIDSEITSLGEDTELLFCVGADVYSIVLQKGYSDTDEDKVRNEVWRGLVICSHSDEIDNVVGNRRDEATNYN